MCTENSADYFTAVVLHWYIFGILILRSIYRWIYNWWTSLIVILDGSYSKGVMLKSTLYNKLSTVLYLHFQNFPIIPLWKIPLQELFSFRINQCVDHVPLKDTVSRMSNESIISITFAFRIDKDSHTTKVHIHGNHGVIRNSYNFKFWSFFL